MGRLVRCAPWVMSALVLVVTSAATLHAIPAEVGGAGAQTLIRRPVDRNYPSFLTGARVSPYREGPSPVLQIDREKYETEVRVDLEGNIVVVGSAWNGISLVHPWVATMPEYHAAVRRYTFLDHMMQLGRKERGNRGGESGPGHFNIDIPVRFPKTLSRIIGQGANIQVSGSESITFSGETQYFVKERDNESGGQRIFPELDMRQQLQVNLTGTIGEKVKVEMQHNSESQVPLENRIKLRYEGFEDEVIQKIEVGNTNLGLPGNEFVSFSSRQQGLFGIKMIGKAGKLDFTTVLSQQQGRTDRETFAGRSRRDSIIINDLNYVKDRYFVVNDYDSVVQIKVFVDDNNGNNNTEGELPGRAYVYGTNQIIHPDSAYDAGAFDELVEGVDYIIDRTLGLLIMNKPLRQDDLLAVWYTQVEAPGIIDTIGFVPPDSLAQAFRDTGSVVLKMIRPRIQFYRPPRRDPSQTSSPFAETWYYQLRNVYDLRARNILQEGFELNIYRKAGGAEERFDVQETDGTSRRFIEVMGLDLVDQEIVPNPDGIVDDIYRACDRPPGDPTSDRIDRPDRDSLGLRAGNLPYFPIQMISFEAGLLFFPDLRPFDPAYYHRVCGGPLLALEETNPTIYDNHDPRPTDSKYEIEVKYRTAQTSFSLGRSNILEGSEVVKLNGRTLTRGTDYRIIYEIGQIEFLTDEALSEDADISIDFEYAPFLSQAQKSLAGAAGSYNLSDDSKLSSILLFKGKRTPYRRPRLGQEPSYIFVSGLSFSTKKEPDFLTRAANWVPGIRAREKSSFVLNLEAAATFPNPNTKDAIYVDDMEGTEEVSSFGITRRQWDMMSVPKLKTNVEEVSPSNRHRSVSWYNPKNSTTRGDLNPSLSQEEKIKFLPVLEVALGGGSLESGDAGDAWGGIMRLVSKTGLDLKDRKFFEVWVNDFGRNKGKMHVDMGLLGEDAMWSTDPPDGRLNTEDRVNHDGVLDDTGGNDPDFDEDSGLDGVFSNAETGDGPADDPAGDDWKYDENTPDDYSKINGTEGNGFLDTEDLNGNGNLDLELGYFRFIIDLASEENVVAQGVQQPGKNWRLYRIPLAKAEARNIGFAPTFDQGVKYVRIWFENLDTTDARFQIVSLEVTGNRWLEAGIQDSTGSLLDSSQADPTEIFAAGVINNKDGEDYTPPPVEIQVERQVPEKEQSLLIQYENLRPGNTGSVFRALFEDEDYTRYSQLEFWVRRAAPSHDLDPYPVFFFRFGGDSLNFYEVIDTLKTGAWRRMELDLAALTRIKLQDPPSLDSLYGREVEVRMVQEGSLVLRTVGQPSMTKVRRLTFGVTNSARDGPLTGIVWVDDLRLINVKGDPGMAGRIAVDVSLSDFLSVSGNYRRVGKEFRRVTGGRGGGRSNVEENPRAGSDDSDLSLQGKLSFGKFLEGVGVDLPFNWGWSRSLKKPELRTGSDIVLEDPGEEKTESKARSASVSIRRSRKAENPFVYYTVDAMDLRLSGDQSEGGSPTRADTGWSWLVDWKYRYSPRFNTDLKVFRDWKVNPFPKSISLAALRKRSENRNLDVRSQSTRIKRDRRSNSNYSFAMSPVNSSSLKSDFSFSAARDHLYGGPLSFLPQLNRGLETKRDHQTKLSYTPGFQKYLSWFSPRFSYDTKFSDDQPATRQAVTLSEDGRDTLSVRRIHNVGNQNSARFDFTVGIGRILSAISDRNGKAADDTTDSGGGGLSVLRGIKAVGSNIGDIAGSVALVRASRYDELVGRPDLKYQLGLISDIDSLLQFRQGNRTRTATRSRDVQTRISTSVKLVKSMNVRISYNRSTKRAEQNRNLTESRSSTWPDLQYSWDGIEEISRLKRLLKSGSLTSGVIRKIDKSGKSLDRIETERVSISWSPLAQIEVEWRNGIQTQVGLDRSRDVNRNFRGGQSERVSQTQGINGSISYRTTSRKTITFPILGKGRKGGSYTATTNFKLTFRLSTSKEEEQNPYRLEGHTRDLSIAPSVSWSWLQNLSGNLELRFGERRNLKNENRSTRTIGASISALFKF